MNLFKKEQEYVKVITPPTLGWLEKKLSDDEMNYLWKCIENRKESVKDKLAGQIHESNILIDKNNWFFNKVLSKLISMYADEFKNLGNSIPTNLRHPYYLQKLWVNYQKENEFNPLHDHTGVYSFVVWMKIPTKHSEQNKNPISLKSNTHVISAFQFQYTNILGQMCPYTYEMSPEMEGTILFFPSKLLHEVYPFFNCDEDRISISGNIALNTAKVL